MWGKTGIEDREYSRILGRGEAITEGEERKGATRSRGGEEGGVMTSIHLSLTRPLHTRMKQCPRRNTRRGHFPSHNTTQHTFVGSSGLWRCGALLPGANRWLRGLGKGRVDNSGHSCALRHGDCTASTSTMGTSMVDEYPTLFRDSFFFPLFASRR